MGWQPVAPQAPLSSLLWQGGQGRLSFGGPVMELTIAPFQAYCLIKSATEENGEWVISGPVASEEEDYDGQTLERSGIIKGLTKFMRMGGLVDWEHLYMKTQNLKYIVGQGSVFYVNGRPWVKTVLDKSCELAQQIWDWVVNKKKRMGYSILGKGVLDATGKRVISTDIDMVTLSPLPKGFDQFIIPGMPAGAQAQLAKAISLFGEHHDFGDLMMVAKAITNPELERSIEVPAIVQITASSAMVKAFTTGAGVVQPGSTGGAALRSQTILRGDGSSMPSASFDGAPQRRKKKRRVVSPIEKALIAKGASPEAAYRAYRKLQNY